MKVLITGANGMLGKDLCYFLDEIGCFIIPTNKEIMDITNNQIVNNVISKTKPDLIIHTAAYTDVNNAEKEKKQAEEINIEGTKNIAKAAKKYNSTLIYISTDYVFNGEKNSPYLPNDKQNPINQYGKTKFKAELEVQKNCEKYYIIRTSWLYGLNGNNFIEKILTNKNKEIKVVEDEIGCPTWTMELIQGILKILSMPYGIYHICSNGETSRYNLAKKIIELEKIDKTIIPISQKETNSTIKRPKYSVMQSNITLKNWEESLKEYLNLRKNS
ncbi:MAG: dTDP-4-dehydrorhamnose reductase [Candidatus Gastranaerophilales bacterium]|nr:dTDP-4-dehydrorhamnose reductase [Candidatus Gastranaerophilales bacterium]